jgi:2-hydroxycyclohexanecarboxyl-CoA dehydrogenase
MTRVAVVTGAASGMGEAISRHLARSDHLVALFDIDEPNTVRVADAIVADGGRAIAYPVEVADRSTVDAAVAKVRSEFGPIEVVVTSAGHSAFEPFETISIESWESIYAVNVLGTFHCIQAAIADMVAAGWGRIVTISSSSGQQGAHRAAHYASSKGAVITLTKALAKEYGRSGITANNIAPSLIETPMQQQAQEAGNIPSADAMAARSPLRRLGTVDEVAATCAFLCSDGAGYITGQVIGVNGGSVL